MLACWVEDPDGDYYKKHLARIPDYLWVAENGMKMQDRPCVDASLFPGMSSFSLGLVLRDHHGNFIQAKNMVKAGAVTVLEAEAWGIAEALEWLQSLLLDSLLTVNEGCGVVHRGGEHSE